MYLCAAQWPRLEAVRLIHPEELSRIAAGGRAVARVGVRVAAAAGFAGAMWLLVAGPGFLDGRSSTVDRPGQRVAAQHAAR